MSNSIIVRKSPVANVSLSQGIGNSLTILKSGSLSVSLPPATNATLGGVIVGDNLSITGNGVLSAQPGGVTAFNNRTGNVSLTSNDVTGSLLIGDYLSVDMDGYLNSTPPILSFNGRTGSVTLQTSDITPLANGTYLVNRVTNGCLTVSNEGTSVFSNLYQNTRGAYWKTTVTSTGYAFSQSYIPASMGSQQIAWGGFAVDSSQGKTSLSYAYAPNFGAGTYSGIEVQVYLDRVELTRLSSGMSSLTANWTTNSLITRGYADSVYLTTANASTAYSTIGHTHSIANVTGLQTALDAKLPSANFTYANLTGTPNLTLYLTTANASSTYQPLGNYATTSCLTFSNITSKPTTLSGYGITDGYSTSNPSGYITAGANSFTGTQNLGGNLLTQAKLQAYRETSTAPTISAGSLTLDLSGSNFFAVSLNAAISTITISNIPSSSVASFTLEFTGTGTTYSVNWTLSSGVIKWAGAASAPTITATTGKKDVFCFYTTDGGSNWLGFIGGQNY